MARRKKTDTTPNEQKTVDYRYSHEKRTNIPPARIAGEGTVPTVPKAKYAYSPHLPPTLQFDPTGEPDKLNDLLDKATRAPLSAAEAGRLREALRVKEPTLEWAGKREQREKGFLEVDPVALHIHERVSARAIIRSALREDVQRDLFADPQQPYQQAVQFYKYDVDWANRLILGDSLQVMSSLARRENLAGKVQMIYMDPPYGIKFASNFQNEVHKREVSEKEHDLTREPEMIKAFRDTWTLGTHSYLSYLRDRLLLCKELLADTGSIFLQISDDNLHRVRALLDEVFSPESFISIITVQKTGSAVGKFIQANADFLLWYAKDKALAETKFRALYIPRALDGAGGTGYTRVEETDGERRSARDSDFDSNGQLLDGLRLWRSYPLTSDGYRETTTVPFQFRDQVFHPGANRHWGVTPDGLERAARANRIVIDGKQISFVRFWDDSPVVPLSAQWRDVGGASDRRYVVQTNQRIIERCVLMTTDPGDLVLDPTSGSGTTSCVAERHGRRWIAIDTSRVAIAVARQRMLTETYPLYVPANGSIPPLSTPQGLSPEAGFRYASAPQIALGTVAKLESLDPICELYEARLTALLDEANRQLRLVTPSERSVLNERLKARRTKTGRRKDLGDASRRMELPRDRWESWEIPCKVDEDWPRALQQAVAAFREVWMEMNRKVDSCVRESAEEVPLVDQPTIVRGVTRVTGPFTVEGVRPEELSLAETGLFDGTANEVVSEGTSASYRVDQRNLSSYLNRMVHLLRQDGLTFINNQRRRFSRVEPLAESGTGTVLHAEGAWDDAATQDVLDVAIGFGPQYGPVTALQVEEFLRASKRHRDLVIAGFSFDAAATALIQEFSSTKYRIHQAYIRPDINPGMDGLLKETSNSQLFTVFGTPEIDVAKTGDGEWEVELRGVDIYDPVANTVRSTGADKVAAWFVDSDFDGRCFCVTQAFFPHQDAWERIAKALGTAADTEAFEAFKGTKSVPFRGGMHKRVAVKVIDPRGNEVMAVRSLEA